MPKPKKRPETPELLPRPTQETHAEAEPYSFEVAFESALKTTLKEYEKQGLLEPHSPELPAQETHAFERSCEEALKAIYPPPVPAQPDDFVDSARYSQLIPPPPPKEFKPTNPKDAAAVERVPLAYLPDVAKAEQALAHYAGALKYGAWNWRAAGVLASVYVSAIERHLARWKAGEERDPEEGIHHLGAVMAGCAILLDATACGKLVDDRAPATVDLASTFSETQGRMAKLHQLYGDRAPRHFAIGDTAECIEEGAT